MSDVSEIVVTGSLSISQWNVDGYISAPYGMDLAGSGGSVAYFPAGTAGEDQQHQIMDQLRQKLIANGHLDSADLLNMQNNGVHLSDLLKPGIYQSEFNVLVLGEHREWIRVNAGGTSDLITARPGDDGLLKVTVETWETSNHGMLGTDKGEMRFYVVGQSINDSTFTNTAWSNMVSEANHDNSLGLHYNFLSQNSNSAFHTVALAGHLLDYDSGFAPGVTRDLNTVDPNNQVPILSLQNSILKIGSSASDVMNGTSSSTHFQGGDGDDQITGVSTYDAIEGQNGNDLIHLGGGSADGGTGADTVIADSTLSVTIMGNDGNDSLQGSTVADQMQGGDGDDFVHGRAGDDQLSGGNGNDTIYGGQGNDIIGAGAGNDQVHGDNGNDTVSGADGDDSLEGASGDDVITGGWGNDTISGGDGNDLIRGNQGADVLTGGIGADQFIFAGKGGDFLGVTESGWWANGGSNGYVYSADTIMDFEKGVDKIDISEMHATSADVYFFAQSDGSVKVDVSLPNGDPSHADLELFVRGAPTLNASDFIFG